MGFGIGFSMGLVGMNVSSFISSFFGLIMDMHGLHCFALLLVTLFLALLVDHSFPPFKFGSGGF